jgi:hypothetical protein
VLRVLKPGGHVLAFAATRTYHRLACAAEDGGLDIWDMVAWLYGCGIPLRSRDVARRWTPTWAPRVRLATSSCYGEGRVVPQPATAAGYEGGLTASLQARGRDPRRARPRRRVGRLGHGAEAGAGADHGGAQADRGNLARNVLAHGTGGLNIDACRVDAAGRPAREWRADPEVKRFLGAASGGSRAVGRDRRGPLARQRGA